MWKSSPRNQKAAVLLCNRARWLNGHSHRDKDCTFQNCQGREKQGKTSETITEATKQT